MSPAADANPSRRPPPASPGAHADDLDLVRRVLAGDAAALEEFSRRMAAVPALLRTRNARLGHPLPRQDLPDVVQDTLVVLWRKLPSYEGRARLETWAWRIATFELLNALRRGDRARRREAGTAGLATLDTLAAAPSEAPRVRFEALHTGLGELPEDEQLVVRLKHYEELTFEQIAPRVGLTASGVKNRYYRALDRLRRVLRRHEEGRAP